MRHSVRVFVLGCGLLISAHPEMSSVRADLPTAHFYSDSSQDPSFEEMNAISAEFVAAYKDLEPATISKWRALKKARSTQNFEWSPSNVESLNKVLQHEGINACIQKLIEASRRPLLTSYETWRTSTAPQNKESLSDSTTRDEMVIILNYAIECSSDISLTDYFTAARYYIVFDSTCNDYFVGNHNYTVLFESVYARCKDANVRIKEAEAIENLLLASPWPVQASHALAEMQRRSIAIVSQRAVPKNSNASERNGVIEAINSFYKKAIQFANERTGKDRFNLKQSQFPSMPDDVADVVAKWHSKAQVAVRSVVQSEVAAKTMESAARVSLAIARFKCVHGTWPNSLSELSPDYLASLPIDETSGQPFVYKPSNSDTPPLLYAIGGDGNDDGGTQSTISNASGLRGASGKHDYIITVANAECPAK